MARWRSKKDASERIEPTEALPKTLLWITLSRTSLAQRFQMSTARSSLGAPSGCESKALMEDTGAGHEHQGRIVGDSAAIIHVIDPIENIDDLLLIEERD